MGGSGRLRDMGEIEEQLRLAAGAVTVVMELPAIGAGVRRAAHDGELLQAGCLAEIACHRSEDGAIEGDRQENGMIEHLLRPHQVEQIALADRTARWIGGPVAGERRYLLHRALKTIQPVDGEAEPAGGLRNSNRRSGLDPGLAQAET